MKTCGARVDETVIATQRETDGRTVRGSKSKEMIGTDRRLAVIYVDGGI